MTTTPTTKPIEDRKLAGVSVAIFRHLNEDRLPRYSTKIVTSFYDEQSKSWKESCYFSDAQLAVLSELQSWAIRRILDLREADLITARAAASQPSAVAA